MKSGGSFIFSVADGASWALAVSIALPELAKTSQTQGCTAQRSSKRYMYLFCGTEGQLRDRKSQWSQGQEGRLLPKVVFCGVILLAGALCSSLSC